MKRAIYIGLAVLIATNTFVSPLLAQETSPASAPTPFSQELIKCLKENLAEDFNAIVSGKEPNLSTEKQALAEGCFEKFSPEPPNGDSKQPKIENLNFAPPTEECLKKTLGADFKQIMLSQGKAIRSQIKDCFGEKVGIGKNNPPGLPTDVKNCIEKAVGVTKAKAMLSGGEPPDIDSPEAAKIEGAGCFNNFQPNNQQGGPSGPPPVMSDESINCFKEKTGTTPDKKPILTKEIRKELNVCFKGSGGPNGGPNGGPPTLPAEVSACFEQNGISTKVAASGPDILTSEQKGKIGECFQKNNFKPHGSNGPENGPQGPRQGGSAMPEGTLKCIEGIMGVFDPSKQPTEEQKQKIGRECFKNGPNGPGNQGGPGGPQGSNQQLPNDKRVCIEKITGGKPPHEVDEATRMKLQQECFGGIGQNAGQINPPNQPPQGPPGSQPGNQPGNQPPGQSGGPQNFQNQPGSNGPQNHGGQPNQGASGFSFPPHIAQCAKAKGINIDDPNKELVSRQINESGCQAGPPPPQSGQNPPAPPPNGENPPPPPPQ